MTIKRITYDDKVDFVLEGKDPRYSNSAKDMNEIKHVFNDSAEDIEGLMKQYKDIETSLNKTVIKLNEDIESGEFIPNFKIGTVETGATSKVTITGTKKEPTLNLTMQKGDKGDTGSTGSKGDKGDQGTQGIQGLKGDKGDGVLVPHIVTELPTTGETSNIYFLIKGNGYITYMWADNKWIILGSGDVDLSNYYTKVESDTKYLPKSGGTMNGRQFFSGYNEIIFETEFLPTEQPDDPEAPPIQIPPRFMINALNIFDDSYHQLMIFDENYNIHTPSIRQNNFLSKIATEHDLKEYLKKTNSMVDEDIVLKTNRALKGESSEGNKVNMVRAIQIDPQSVDVDEAVILGCLGTYAIIQTALGQRPRVMDMYPSLSNFHDAEEIAYLSDLGGIRRMKMTQAQYDALATKDANTEYLIVG